MVIRKMIIISMPVMVTSTITNVTGADVGAHVVGHDVHHDQQHGAVVAPVSSRLTDGCDPRRGDMGEDDASGARRL